MATIKKLRYQDDATFGGVPYGNTTSRSFNLTTKANGAAVNSDTATAIGDGDSVVLGLLPAGMLLQDAVATVSDAFTALTVGKLGFAYTDGVDSTEVPQDDDYFFQGDKHRTGALAQGCQPGAYQLWRGPCFGGCCRFQHHWRAGWPELIGRPMDRASALFFFQRAGDRHDRCCCEV